MSSVYDGIIRILTKIDTTGVKTGVADIKKEVSAIGAVAGGIGKAMLALKAASVLVDFGKQAVSLASDLQEVQNVVDTAFGDMAYKCEEFASIAIEQFGMSELAAKQASSTYMAMAKSMGIAAESASDMAIEIAKLTGDVASFYNITQDEASTKLKSIFTGETETLKDLGVVMTQANLKAYALSIGITKDISAMTQAELVSLRYKYVMQQLSMAQGDFAKTSGSWANQTRVLSERWKEFLSIIGEGLITVLLPVVKFLNTVLSVLIKIAEAIGWVAANVFGIKSALGEASGASAGLAGSASDAADSEYDLASGISAAGNAAKKALAPFDELNILQNNLSSGGGAGLDGLNFDFGSNQSIKEAIEDLENREIKVPITVVPDAPTPLLDPEPVTVEVQPNIIPIPDPVYEPNWGLTPPPIEPPEFPPLPVPVYVPEWNLMESLDTELAAIKQGMIVFAGEFSRQWDNIATSLETVCANMETNLAALRDTAIATTSEWANATSTAVQTWATNVSEAVYQTAYGIIQNVGTAMDSAYTTAANFINESSKGFVAWGNAVLETVGKTAEGFVENFISGLRTAWDNFVSFMNAVGETIVGFFTEHKALALTLAVGVTAVGLSLAFPGIGSAVAAGIGKLAAPAIGAAAMIPALASGAAIPPNNEFLAVLGDQKSGYNIEAPEGLLRQIQQEGNADILSALNRIARLLEAGQTIEVDGIPFGQVVHSAYNKEERRKGISLANR